MIFYATNSDSIENYGPAVSGVIVTIAIYFIILWLFVFKTEWLISKLKLERGFTEERIEFSIPRSTILSVSIIIIGGLVFVDSLSGFCKELFSYWQQKHLFVENSSSAWLILNSIKVILGYFLMTNSKYLVSLLIKMTGLDDFNK